MYILSIAYQKFSYNNSLCADMNLHIIFQLFIEKFNKTKLKFQ